MMKLQDIIGHENNNGKQVGYADDFIKVKKSAELRKWCYLVNKQDPKIGYCRNATKSMVFVKPEAYGRTKIVFQGSNVKLSMTDENTSGQSLEQHNTKSNVKRTVKRWEFELQMLDAIAKIEPQVAYAACKYGVK